MLSSDQPLGIYMIRQSAESCFGFFVNSDIRLNLYIGLKSVLKRERAAFGMWCLGCVFDWCVCMYVALCAEKMVVVGWWCCTIFTHTHTSRHVDTQRPAGVLVDDVAYGNGGQDFDEIGRNAAVQTSWTLSCDNSFEHACHCVFLLKYTTGTYHCANERKRMMISQNKEYKT